MRKLIWFAVGLVAALVGFLIVTTFIQLFQMM